MHNKLRTAIATGLFLSTSVAISEETPSMWYEQGKAAINNQHGLKLNQNKAKNIILMVGDGMGVSTVTAARIFEGQLRGETGEENLLSFERFPNVALSKTYNTNQQTADSAGTMTAMVSGVKTKAGVIGVNQNVLRSDCASSQGNEVKTFLEEAEEMGKATGIISTARITHATPAATYAHSPERGWEDDDDLSEEAVASGCKDIAAQLIDFSYGDGVDIAMGGGRRSFIPATTDDPEDAGKTGNRLDGRDLTKEWADKGSNYYFAWNEADFNTIPTAADTKILGLFNRSHLEYELDRPEDTGGEPSLSQMTKKSIDILSQNDNGFFLMVESGRIDHAHHGGNARRALTDAVEFSNAVKTVLDNVDLNETLVIVTADHSHVFTIAGYPTRGNPILGKVVSNDGSGLPSDSYSTDANGLPYTTLGYTNGPGYREGARPDLTNIDTTTNDFLQEATVPLSSETHAAEDVAIYATGAFSHLINGVQEQNVIYHAMKAAAQPSDLTSSTGEVNVTGSWYEPSASGIGFYFLQAPNGLVLTYHGYDKDGNALWLESDVIADKVIKNEDLSVNLYRSGVGNNTNFDSPSVGSPRISEWGTLKLNFSSCTAGQATLSGSDGDREFTLTRLAYADGAVCFN